MGPRFEYEHNVIINLQLVSDGPTVNRTFGGNTTMSRQFVPLRYTNKDFLDDLKDQGTIPSITGWSIVVVTDELGNFKGSRIVKKGAKSIPIPLTLVQAGPANESINGTTVSRTRRYTATSQKLALSSFALSTSDISILAYGTSRTTSAVTQDFVTSENTNIVQNITCISLNGYGQFISRISRVDSRAFLQASGSVTVTSPTKVPVSLGE